MTNIGFCSQLLNIIYAIAYCEDTNRKLYICCRYSMYPDIRLFLDLQNSIEYIDDIEPGIFINQDNIDTCFPTWDYPNAPYIKENLKNLEIITNHPISFERKRKFSLQFIPKIRIDFDIKPPYDSIHIRRGDQINGENNMRYINAMKFIEKTNNDNVFVMSDDYNVLNEINTNKKIHNIILPCMKGFIATPSYCKYGSDIPFSHKSYDEKYKLTCILIREIYICANSEYFIGNFISSIPNIIKFIHKDPSKCIDIRE